MTRLTAPPEITAMVQRLQAHGHDAVLVGGGVRDQLLGRPPKDFDLATSARPDEVARLFAGAAVTTRFGTTLVPSIRGGAIEVTTFRSEGDYTDFRRPDTVAFSGDLLTDLARRDFTMNAIAWDPIGGSLIDPYGGQADIAAKRIRAVGDPAQRFGEDALRMLRAVRFMAVLGFAIEPATATSISRQAELTRHLARERVGAELMRLLQGRHAPEALQVLARSGLGAACLPELAGGLSHGVAILKRLTVNDPVMALAILGHEAGQGQGLQAARIMAGLINELALGDEMADVVGDTICVAGLVLDGRANDAAIWRAIRSFGAAEVDAGLRIRSACRGDDGLLRRVEAVRRLRLPASTHELAIGGDDLVAIGLKPGPAMGSILRELLEAVTDGACRNERGALLAAASQPR